LSREIKGPASDSDNFPADRKQVFSFKTLFQAGFDLFEKPLLAPIHLILGFVQGHPQGVPRLFHLLDLSLGFDLFLKKEDLLRFRLVKGYLGRSAKFLRM
jgi:hypothetical protein